MIILKDEPTRFHKVFTYINDLEVSSYLYPIYYVPDTIYDYYTLVRRDRGILMVTHFGIFRINNINGNRYPNILLLNIPKTNENYMYSFQFLHTARNLYTELIKEFKFEKVKVE